MTKSLKDIRNITVSGRIASGTTTLAKGLKQYLGWNLLEGGEIFGEYHKKINATETEVAKRPDEVDLEYDEMVKNLLKTEEHQIIQSHLAGFNAQDIPKVFKILVICENDHGQDMPEKRAERLSLRKRVSHSEAMYEVINREKNLLKKWRRLYADNNPDWVYWDKKYYNLVINTYDLNQKLALNKAISSLEGSTQSIKTSKSSRISPRK